MLFLKAVLVLMAIEHVYFLVLEMFLWKSLGQKLFKLSPSFAQESAPLAANQGLYNGFLAAGVVWALLTADSSVALFFSSCILIAGVYGGLTVSKRILYVQAVPALVALLLIFANL